MTDQVIELTDVVDDEFEDAEDFRSEQAAIVAAALTTRPTETRELLARLQPTEDNELKRERARFMLERLRVHGSALRAGLDLQQPLVRHVMRALVEGDHVELAELGVAIDYAWLDDALIAMITGAPFVEFETVGPYAVHHINESGGLDVRMDRIPNDERTGLLLAGMLRDVTSECDNVRLVALLDDYTTDPTGRPLTAGERDRYVLEIGRILRRHGAIREGDIPGKDYVLVRESMQVAAVDELIERLRHVDAGTISISMDGDVIFHPTAAFVEKLALESPNRRREFIRRGIMLKRTGRPTCQALDAATFLDASNRDIFHVIVLDKHFRSQQDKTYALIRAVGIVRQERHHNVFFDAETLSPELITYIFCELLTEQLRHLMRVFDRIDGWDRFDPDEYAQRNYGDRILGEDRDIINFVIRQLDEARIPEAGVALVADVGTGPNFYPAMLLAPYVADDGAIDIIEYSSANRAYAQATMLHHEHTGDSGMWRKFEELMIGAGGDVYDGAFDRACRNLSVMAGSILSLPKNRYDIITSYFVAESITVSRREFRLAIQSLASCVKPNGVLVVAHMVGSDEWHAGVDTHFPAVHLTLEDIEEAYRDADLTFSVCAVGEGGGAKARDGYEGMAVVVARRARS